MFVYSLILIKIYTKLNYLFNELVITALNISLLIVYVILLLHMANQYLWFVFLKSNLIQLWHNSFKIVSNDISINKSKVIFAEREGTMGCLLH